MDNVALPLAAIYTLIVVGVFIILRLLGRNARS